MPFVKSGGKWVASDGEVGKAGPERLVLVDSQVDNTGQFQKALNDGCRTINFDSKVDSTAQLSSKIRKAHKESGQPFLSIAFANHGPDQSGLWSVTTDLQVDTGADSTSDAIDKLAPLVEVLISSLEKGTSAHICFLGCSLANAKFLPDIVPAMENLYHVDFMASTDATGNEASGGNWKLETDGDFDFTATYCNNAALQKYMDTMPGHYMMCGGGGAGRKMGGRKM